MANQERYNGWTNYETWAVNLWLGNDSGTDEYWREIAQECWNQSETETSFTRAERATLTLADRIKADIEDGQELYLSQSSGVYADLLSAAISEVNWYEIAEHFIADVDQTWEESDEYDSAIDNPREYVDGARNYVFGLRADYSAWQESFDTLTTAIDSLPVRLSCDQCQMLAINGVPCHEANCPNSGARWDSDRQEWVKQRECFACGYTVDADDPCCNAEPENDER